MRLTSRLLSLLRFQKHLDFPGDLRTFHRMFGTIQQTTDLPFEMIQKDDRTSFLIPKVSVGILTDDWGNEFEKLVLQITIKELNSKKTRLEFRGSMNRSHWFIAFVFVFALTGAIASQDWIPIAIVSFMWPFSHWWFNFVWNAQYYSIVNKIKYLLKRQIIWEYKQKKGRQ